MGANIGTTVTSFIIGFKLGDYALPMLYWSGLSLLHQEIALSITSDNYLLVSVVLLRSQSYERCNGTPKRPASLETTWLN